MKTLVKNRVVNTGLKFTLALVAIVIGVNLSYFIGLSLLIAFAYVGSLYPGVLVPMLHAVPVVGGLIIGVALYKYLKRGTSFVINAFSKGSVS